MRIDPKLIPDHIIRLMSPADRSALGKSAVTVEEHAEKAGDVAEKILQEQMIALLHHRGITPNWSRMDKPKTDRVGWPDLTFAIPSKNGFGIPCAVEVKRPGKTPTPEQIEMMEMLVENGWAVRVITSLVGFRDFLTEIESLQKCKNNY